jgi:hypothetical protein
VCFPGPGAEEIQEPRPLTFMDFLPSGRVFTFFSLSCFSRENDVAGIDVNMGCPKEYSTKVKSFMYIP